MQRKTRSGKGEDMSCLVNGVGAAVTLPRHYAGSSYSKKISDVIL